VPPGNKYQDLPTIHLQVVSDLVRMLAVLPVISKHVCLPSQQTRHCSKYFAVQHDSSEYGAEIQEDGQHCKGPFYIDVSPRMRIEDLRLVIQVLQFIALPADGCVVVQQLHSVTRSKISEQDQTCKSASGDSGVQNI